MSWLERHLHLNQLTGPQHASSRQPRDHREQPLRLLSQQIRSTFLSTPPDHSSTLVPAHTASTSTSSSTIVSPSPCPDHILDEPPPAYHSLFPHGAPVSVEMEFATIPNAHQQSSPREGLPSDCEAWDLSPNKAAVKKPSKPVIDQGRVERGRPRGRPRRNNLTHERVRVFEHYNLGVDPALYRTTRIDTEGARQIFILTPRAIQITHLSPQLRPVPAPPQACPPPRPRARTPSPPVLSIPDDEVDYRAPNLHQVPVAQPLPSMGDTENNRNLGIRILKDSQGNYSIL